ncbi:MAG: hypothetical protein ABH814_00745 [bacterium]
MPKSLPKNLWSYFWDINPQNVNVAKKRNFVIGRLLDKGNTEAASWVFENFPTEVIRKSFSTIRDISPKTANFWKVYLKIPDSEMLCLQKPYLKTRKSHWKF